MKRLNFMRNILTVMAQNQGIKGQRKSFSDRKIMYFKSGEAEYIQPIIPKRSSRM
jgi:hypothetical protein